MSIVFAKKDSNMAGCHIGIFVLDVCCVFVGVCVGTGGGTPPPYLGAVQRHSPLLLQGFQCCGVVGLVGDFVDEVAVDDAAVFVEDEDASGEEPCEGSVNEL